MDPIVQRYIDEQIQKIEQPFKELERLFLQHKHSGPLIDQTKKLVPTMYAGEFNSSGVASDSPWPKSWTLTKDSTGVYTVTHGFGHVNYAVVAMLRQNGFVRLYSQNQNYFTLRTYDTSAVLNDQSVHFIVASVI